MINYRRAELEVLAAVDRARATCPREATVWHAWARSWPSSRWKSGPAGASHEAAIASANAARDDAAAHGHVAAQTAAEAAAAIVRAADLIGWATYTAGQVAP